MEVPILMGVEGEAKEIVENYNAGICFEPENEKDFIAKLKIVTNPENQKVFKEGCKGLAIDFDRKNLAEKMLNVLHQASGK